MEEGIYDLRELLAQLVAANHDISKEIPSIYFPGRVRDVDSQSLIAQGYRMKLGQQDYLSPLHSLRYFGTSLSFFSTICGW